MSSVLSCIAGTWYLGVIGIVCGIGMLMTAARTIDASKKTMVDVARNPLAYDETRIRAEIKEKMWQAVESNKFATDRHTDVIIVSIVYLAMSLVCMFFGY